MTRNTTHSLGGTEMAKRRGRPPKLKENQKAFWRLCHKAQGTWEHFQDARTAARRRGLSVDGAWREAMKEVPIQPGVSSQVICAKLDGEPIERLPPMLRREDDRPGRPPSKETGIELLDWVY